MDNPKRTLVLWEDRCTDAFLADSPRAYRICLSLLLTGGVLTMALLFFTRCSPLFQFPNDSLMLLDTGSRMLEGQRPHTDFYTPIEFIPCGLIALGIMLAGPGGFALVLPYLIMFPIVLCLTWLLCRVRLAAFPALLLSSMTALLLVAPFPMGYEFRFGNYAMQYNRLGWALLCMLAMLTLIPPRVSPSSARQLLEGVLTGLVLAATVFIKINYLTTAIGIVLVGFVIFPPRAKTLLTFLASLAGGLLVGFAYMHFDLAAWINDFRTLSGSNSTRFILGMIIKGALRNREMLLALVLLVLLIWKALIRNVGRSSPLWVRSLLATVALSGAGVLTISINCQEYSVPLLGVASLLLVEVFRRETMLSPTSTVEPAGGTRFRFLCCNIIMFVIVGTVLLPDICGVVWLPVNRITSSGGYTVQSERLKDIVFVPSRYESELPQPGQVREWMITIPGWSNSPVCLGLAINDGLGLLRRHVRPEDRLFLLDTMNPFPYILGLKHIHGDVAYWVFGRTVDEGHAPPPALVLKEATLVLWPKLTGGSSSNSSRMIRLYGPAILENFDKIDESDMYVLYRRKN